MTFQYTIFSIDDSRKAYKDEIRARLPGWKYVEVPSVNGNKSSQLHEAMYHHPYALQTKLKVGQLGIIYGVLNALDQAPIVTFEDDAILANMFEWNFRRRMTELPDDADFFSLFLARNQDHLYDERLAVSEHLTQTYQTYGGVSMYYTPKGAERVKRLLYRDGIWGQYDDMLYAYSQTGDLNGYCSKPTVRDLVHITGYEQSLVQTTEYMT